MDLKQPFLKLPIGVCAETLEAEVRALPKSAWKPHPQRFAGNEAVPLVTPGGEVTDALSGPMAATDYLKLCPYLMEVMAELGAVWGRSRLMGLGPGATVPSHVDIDYYWRTHFRIHIPVITNPDVRFTCDSETVHMGAGECWVFDTFRRHGVVNGGSEQRVHIVLDTVGGEHLWELMRAAANGAAEEVTRIVPGRRQNGELAFETVNSPKVMSPWEMRCHLAFIIEQTLAHPRRDLVTERLDRFVTAWSAAWTRFGDSGQGLSVYRDLVAKMRGDLPRIGAGEITLRNERKLDLVLERLILLPAIAAEGAAAVETGRFAERLERPVFIVSSPRSGSTLLFETLAQSPDLFTIGGESHRAIESISELSPASHNWESNRLTKADATETAVEQLAQSLFSALRDRDGRPPHGRVRMLEKTPKNALRVPFFDSAFEGATFVYLYRDARPTLSSMMDAWLSGRFRTYARLPGWAGHPWSLLLVPGWRELSGRPLAEIVAHQWAITTSCLLDDLERIPRERVRAIAYDALVADPQGTIEKLAASLGVRWDRELAASLPLSKYTLTPPDPEKWHRNEAAIESVWPIVEAADTRARRFVAELQL